MQTTNSKAQKQNTLQLTYGNKIFLGLECPAINSTTCKNSCFN